MRPPSEPPCTCVRGDDTASHHRLLNLLRSPQLSRLWSSSVRAEGVSTELAPTLASVAAEHGARVTFEEQQRLFARHPSLPCLTGTMPRPGVAVRPLQRRHLPRLRRHRRTCAAPEPADLRLSAGVYLTSESADEPTAWALVSREGALAFGDSERADDQGEHRRLAVAEVTRLCQHLDVPCVSAVPDTDLEAFRDLMRLDFISAHAVLSAELVPVAAADAQGTAEATEPESRAARMHGV
ncbi:hypothetical protein FJT64_002170 [Amphibalanus amphitrite]|uniref:Uncharacterized protein n=1 Tax=Amphibalanus amphitrite TaxID=1232801 RepID=A0A6A4WQQ7_AMPAM|nr:hypothetical protein FJT64_002170 [Amphibalanus amphitrite]